MRAWLGVPSATFATSSSQLGPSLFVYYQAENNHGWTSIDSGGAAEGAPPFGATAQAAGEAADASAANYAAAVSRTGSNDLRGTWVKRIDADALRGVRGTIYQLLGTPMSEDTWTRANAIPGELLGRVRFWLAEPGDYPNVRRFHLAFDTIADTFGTGHPLWYADAAAGTCNLGTNDEHMHLYFAANPDGYARSSGLVNASASSTNQVPTGHGVWVSAAVPDGESLVVRTGAMWSTTVTAVQGRDFVCRAPTSSKPMGDCVKASTGPLGYYWFDPDPAQLGDGSWQVQTGHNYDPGSPGEADQALRVTEGAEADGCRAWTDAWDTVADGLEPELTPPEVLVPPGFDFDPVIAPVTAAELRAITAARASAASASTWLLTSPEAGTGCWAAPRPCPPTGSMVDRLGGYRRYGTPVVWPDRWR